MAELQQEEFVKLKGNRAWPDFKAGDSVQISRLPHISANEPELLKGLVISKTNRLGESTATIINMEQGSTVIRQIKIYNPLITDIKVLQRDFIHDGKKRTRRSKLYYMLDRDPSNYTVK